MMRNTHRLIVAAAIALAAAGVAFAAAPSSAPSVSPADALQQLLDGNQLFVAGKMSHPNQTPERRGEVAKGQHPFAAILACSDSRSGPEVLFDRGLGDLFVVRVAGNVLDRVVVESLDYAVTHLGARLVVVMGHTRCGAVIAAVEGHDEPGDVGPMLRELKPAVEAAHGMSGDPVANAVRENVILSVKRLKASRELADKVKSGEVKVVGAVYDLDSGKVEMLPE
jgi:carbonic anhydrase